MLSSREFIAQLSGLSSELGQCAALFQAYSMLAPPLLTNLLNIYVETQNVAFLIHSSNVSARYVISPFLMENERDILDLSHSLLQLHHLVEGGSNQIRDLEGYVIHSSTMVVKWLGPDTGLCRIASLITALLSCPWGCCPWGGYSLAMPEVEGKDEWGYIDIEPTNAAIFCRQMDGCIVVGADSRHRLRERTTWYRTTVCKGESALGHLGGHGVLRGSAWRLGDQASVFWIPIVSNRFHGCRGFGKTLVTTLWHSNSARMTKNEVELINTIIKGRTDGYILVGVTI
ncbi:hypothetical protein BDN71DRAFT_1435477 [Pleurotus eryngii]|uniref:Uncharacterized protein n=1 Tax=Pleurotus eryngii TaxID=5323 RepID=A0A9P5ZP64_PLEER|nr:hypothetical protein BDN71DRAFT_1435477 [Pleurotus eryngii]